MLEAMTVRAACQADIPSIARVHVDAWRTTYRGIVADSYLAGLSNQKHEERHRHMIAEPGTKLFVAELPEEGVVAFLSGGRERSCDLLFPAEVYAIYLLEKHQRRGIGSALVRQWAENMQREGLNAGLVWVLADNKSAIAFYERLGGKLLLREQNIKIGGDSLREVAYGWEDLRALSEWITSPGT
jgi:ribosomal protein S18 acetylase RimI-like enzyme